MALSKCYSAFVDSKSWDHHYGLPLRPHHDNPHVYMAAFLWVSQGKLKIDELETLKANWLSFMNACRIRSGLFNRWPSGKGGRMSHDELLGIIYCAQKFQAMHIIDELRKYLDDHDGVYNNTTDTNIIGDSAFDQYRLLHLRPCITSAMGIPLTLRSQMALTISMLSSAIFGQGNGTHWRQALVNDLCVKRSHGLLCLTYSIWKWIMNKKGKTPIIVMDDYFGTEPHAMFVSINWPDPVSI